MIVAQVHVATSVVPIQSEIQFPHERATCLTSQLLHFTCISSLASCLLRPTRISAAFSVSRHPPRRNFWPKILHFISNLTNQVYIVHMCRTSFSGDPKWTTGLPRSQHAHNVPHYKKIGPKCMSADWGQKHVSSRKCRKPCNCEQLKGLGRAANNHEAIPKSRPWARKWETSFLQWFHQS